MSFEFNGKVIAITGAGEGLGHSYALYFTARVATIIVNNRRNNG